MSSGIVMNGPAPIMFVMLSAVALSRLKRRSRCVLPSFLLQRLGDRSFGERRHDAIPGLVRVHPVRCEIGSHALALVGHRRVVVEVNGTMRRGVLLHPR